jgi:large subunit ribosomal protein L13
LSKSAEDGYCLQFGAAVFARPPPLREEVLPVRTYSPKAADITRQWHVIDAEGAILGRLSTEIATLLRGKHKPIWAPHLDTGDHVVIVNASKLAVGARKLEQKTYHRHSGYPGGIRSESLEHLLGRNPERVVKLAVRRMLPKGPLGRQMLKKLKVYAGPTHPHQAQQPVERLLPERSKARLA